MRVVIDTGTLDWIQSPRAGVWRKPLAREEAERGHATSIVKYEAGASFSVHNHPLGEEILVLEGTFSDETGDYQAGTYFRNPEGFRHAPFSREGCVILVKLHQFQAQDTEHICIDTHAAEWQAGTGNLKVCQLHEFNGESVMLVDIPAGETIESHAHEHGEEVYVISGGLNDEYDSYPAGTWLRNPDQSHHAPYVKEDTRLWVKSGHLSLNRG